MERPRKNVRKCRGRGFVIDGTTAVNKPATQEKSSSPTKKKTKTKEQREADVALTSLERDQEAHFGNENAAMSQYSL